MICTSCKTIYSPAEEELGKVDSLAGLCEKCGTEPRFKRFAIAFAEAAIGSVLAIEALALLWLTRGWPLGLAPPLIVAIMCFVVYLIANQSQEKRHKSIKQRQKATRGQRIVGGAVGLTVGIVAILVSLRL